MKLSIIVAMDENKLIGLNGALPWHLPRDLKYFKDNTTGKPVIMGRKTYESIGRALPNRTNIVLSRDMSFDLDDAVVYGDILDAYAYTKRDEEAFIIGGGYLYMRAQHRADRILLTKVHTTIDVKDSDETTYFSLLKPEDWVLVSEEFHPADEKNEFDMTFMVYERIK